MISFGYRLLLQVYVFNRKEKWRKRDKRILHSVLQENQTYRVIYRHANMTTWKERTNLTTSLNHVWCLDFSESLDHRSIHQLSAILQNKKRRRWRLSVAPPMAKSVFKTQSLEQYYLDLESRTFLGVICFSFMEGGKRIRLSRIVDYFFP